MNRNDKHEALLIAQGEGHLITGHTTGASTPEARPAPRKMGIGQKIVVGILLTIVLVPPLGGSTATFPVSLCTSWRPPRKPKRLKTLPPFRASRWSRGK